MENFNSLNINPAIMKSIEELGYTKPSPIQAETLPLLLGQDTDFLGLAATGTGKTAAFSIPLLERIDVKVKGVQGLVLCPTRELALQVSGQINILGKHLGIKAIAIYGGASYGDQFHGLKSGANIVVGTPGRIIDHLDRGSLVLTNTKTLILDEADEMISMGFQEALEKILESVDREESNIWLFSATMSRGVRSVADSYLENPKHVHINKKEMLSTTVEQFYYMTHESDKPEILSKIIDAADDFYGLVFCQTKSLVVDLSHYLTSQGYKVDSLHGDKDQNARERTLRAFRDRKINVLICTDVASRGIDIQDITHVINYSLPRELDNYVHRIGRTARSGKTGFAMCLVTNSHRDLIYKIEKLTKSKMKEGKVPTRKEIGTKKLGKFLENFLEQPNFTKAIDLMDDKWKAALATMSSEEVAARFLAITYPKVFTDEPRERNAMPGKPSSEGPQRSRRNDQDGRRDRPRSNNPFAGREEGMRSGRRPGGSSQRRSDSPRDSQRRNDRPSRAGGFGPRSEGGYSRPRRDEGRDESRSSRRPGQTERFSSFKRNEDEGPWAMQ